jgi:hypothetical protein
LSKNKEVTSFIGVQNVKPAGTLCEKKLQRLRNHLGFASHVLPDEFRQSHFEVESVCEQQGIQLKGVRNGVTAEIWVSPRYLEPVPA